MLKDITLGQYYPGDSCIHKLDPRFKILATLAYIVALFISVSFTSYIFTLAYLLIGLVLAKIPIRFILRGMKPIVFILALTFIFNLFLIRSGDVVFQLGFLKITDGGVRTAVFLASRLFMLIISSSLLTYTTKPIMLTDAIEKLLNPLKAVKVPVHELAMMMSIALRFIPVHIEETDKIMKAQMARGADFESGNLLNRVKGLVPILIPLFISSLRRADELAMAMEARCYRGGENRTKLHNLKYGYRDAIGALLTVMMLAALIIQRIMF